MEIGSHLVFLNSCVRADVFVCTCVITMHFQCVMDWGQIERRKRQRQTERTQMERGKKKHREKQETCMSQIKQWFHRSVKFATLSKNKLQSISFCIKLFAYYHLVYILPLCYSLSFFLPVLSNPQNRWKKLWKMLLSSSTLPSVVSVYSHK